MPKVGETVLVGHLSNGTTSAVIIGPIWHEGNRPEDIGTRTLTAEHIQLNSFGDKVETSVADLDSRITKLERW